jgi:hypothetical protein
MRIKPLVPLTVLATVYCFWAGAQNYDTNGDFVQTFAGSGFSGYLDGTGVSTMFATPTALVADSRSNLFVWDSRNYRIRKISPDGIVTTFAGGGNQTSGIGTNVNLFQVGNGGGLMAIDKNDTIWMGYRAGSGGITVYCISNNASVSNYFVTLPTESGFSVPEPVGICSDSFGTIYLAGFNENQIYKWTPTQAAATLFAGSGNAGYSDGNGIFTAFNEPTVLACDQANNIYVWDANNSLIRKIDQSANVSTFAGQFQHAINGDGLGTNASFGTVGQMCFDHSANLYVACGTCIRKVDATTNAVTMAGNFTQYSYSNDLAGNLARFNTVSGVCIAQGIIFAADSFNQRIREITFNPSPVVVSNANLGIATYPGLTVTGIVGRTYQIQSSPDLSAWSTRATILLTASPYLWIDTNPIAGNQFYRALLLP